MTSSTAGHTAGLTTFIKPEYYKTSARHKPVDGVQFFSYVVGIARYARISEDGQIMVISNGMHRATYSASIIGHGPVCNPKTGKPTRFRSQDAASKAAVAIAAAKGGA